jgi:hypothetical protein
VRIGSARAMQSEVGATSCGDMAFASAGSDNPLIGGLNRACKFINGQMLRSKNYTWKSPGCSAPSRRALFRASGAHWLANLG